MAQKKDFDLVMLTIGYNKYAMPREAAMTFFNACCGNEVYRMDTRYRSASEGGTLATAEPFELDALPTISALNPVLFFAAIENKKMLNEQQAAKEAAEAAKKE